MIFPPSNKFSGALMRCGTPQPTYSRNDCNGAPIGLQLRSIGKITALMHNTPYQIKKKRTFYRPFCSQS
jgi:hypothetical protein